MVPGKGVSQWSLPCTLTLKGTQGSGWVGGVAPTPALSEISMLLLVKVSPETDQRQNSTHGGGGGNHSSRGILPFEALISLSFSS